MATVTSFLAGHRVRAGAVGLAFLIALSVAWYLGSPLFIRTYTNETVPAVSAATAAPASTSGATNAPTAAARVLAQGELGYVDTVHNGKGPVRIIELGGQRFVRFEDVAITNAPDIHVYLSRESGGKWSEAGSIYLGALKATNGSFNYEVPAGITVGDYKSVVVWCRAFGVLITWADLT